AEEITSTTETKTTTEITTTHTPITIEEKSSFTETMTITHEGTQPTDIQTVTKEISTEAQPAGSRMEIEILEQKPIVEADVTHRQSMEMLVSASEDEVDEPHPTIPEFISKLEPQLKVMDGDEVTFRCSISSRARPVPTITWFHDNKVVEETPDFQLRYISETGECIMKIVEVFPQDTGEYRCEAEFPHGTAVTTCYLTVD
ncbi:unnamed protein product, partial [Owenia fusiformis]